MSLKYQSDDEPPVPSIALRVPQPVYTLILVGAILVVFVAQLAAGLENSILRAGFVKPDFLNDHEYWRILTGAATHGGLVHVAMNCYAFYSLGRIFEMLANRAHLAIVFLLAAIGGGLLSLAVVPDGISVGASGGIVGLISYLAVYAFRRRQFISSAFRKNLLINIGFIIIFGLALYQVVDNYGHIGGLITGAVYGLIQIPSNEYVDPRKATPAVKYVGIAAMAIFLFTCVFSVLKILGIL